MVNKPEIHTAILSSESPERTREIAEALGRRCSGGETILLFGDLGSGKTCFVQGLGRGMGIPPPVRIASPTFTLHAEYRGRLVLNHLDLYRLDLPHNLDGLGIDEMLMDPAAVTAVEWPEIMNFPPEGERLEIRLTDLGGNCREIAFSAFGRKHGLLLEGWRKNPLPSSPSP